MKYYEIKNIRQKANNICRLICLTRPAQIVYNYICMHSTIQNDLMRKHIDAIILKSLYGGDRYGVDIVKEVEAKSSGQFLIKTPTIYSSFRRLEAQGIIRSYWGDTARGGQRKYYSITNEGHEFFAKQQTDWEYFRTIGDSLISDRDFDLSSMPPLVITKKPRKPKALPQKAEVVAPAAVIQEELEDDPSKYRFNFIEGNEEYPLKAEESAEEANTIKITDNPQVTEENSAVTAAEKQMRVAGNDSSSPVVIVINNHAPANEDKTQTTIREDYEAMRQAPDSYSESLQRVPYAPEDRTADNSDDSDDYFVDFTDAEENEELPEPAFFSGSGETYTNEPTPTNTLQAYESYSPYNKTPVYATQMEPDYKNVLTKLARPAMQERTEKVESPDFELAYNTGYSAYKDLQAIGYKETSLAEISRNVVEVGDNFKVRTFDTVSPDEYSSANYYYSNKLMLAQNIILFCVMLAQIVVSFGIFMFVYNPQYPEPDWVFYIGAVLIAAAVPVFAVILAWTDNNRTKRYNSTFMSNLLFKTIVALQLAIVIYVVNIIMGMPVRVIGSGQNITGSDIGARRIVSFFLPMVLILNLPLSAVVFHFLYRSRKWAVDRYSEL